MLSDTFTIADQPKFFGRRKGRTIHKAKSVLLEKFLPRLRIEKDKPLQMNKLFAADIKKIYLEIGDGAGHDVRTIFTTAGWKFVRSEMDLAGIERVLVFSSK